MVTLTEDQRRAVEFDGSHLRILAGPGSGKTRVIVQRIDDLVTRRGVSGYDLTAITFTRKAAGEMVDRLRLLPCGEEVERKAFVGTAHAFAARVLRTFGSVVGYQDTFSIYDDKDEEDLLAAVVSEFPEYKPKDVRREVAEFLTGPPGEDGLFPAYPSAVGAAQFLHRLRSAQAVTFDVLLYEAIRILRASPKARETYRTPYLFYDEAQDFNVFDSRLIEALGPDHLTVVGDLNQNVYGFRGTTPHFLDDMPEHWEGMETIHLAENFRSTPWIVEASNRLIAYNYPDRVPRPDFRPVARPEDADFDADAVVERLVPRSARPGESRVYISDNPTEEGEARTIAAQVSNLVMSLYKPRQIAILTRTHRQHRPISDALMEAEIPFRVLGRRDLWKDPTGRAVLALLRLVANPRDDHSYGLVVNWPSPRATTRDLVTLKQAALEQRTSLLDVALGGVPVSMDARAKLSGFQDGVAKAAEFWKPEDDLDEEATPSSLLDAIRNQGGLDRSLRALGLVSRIDVLDDLFEWIDAWECRQPEHVRPGLVDLLETLAFRSVQDEIAESTKDEVLVMTAHAAKGLEWANVFVAGMEEGTFPIRRKDTDPEEERRLFYVAMTRAEESLWLSCTRSRPSRPGGPVRELERSPFLDELQGGVKVRSGFVAGGLNANL